MVSAQIINKILHTKKLDILEENNIPKEYLVGYEDEIDFIYNHTKKYGNVPDVETFVSHFNEFEIVDVQESDKYLIDTLKEEYLFNKSVPVVENIAKLLNTDANEAVEYMLSATKDLTPTYDIKGVDIIQQAQERYEEYLDRRSNKADWFFPTGFPELDDVINGIQRTEEYFVIFARTNQGKSWILEKMCTNVWQLGYNVGYISPEMGASSIGYRFDTLYRNFSNRDLVWGNTSLDEKAYKDYVEKLKEHNNKFVVATPDDFNKQLTVSKVRNFIKQNKLDLIAIDGITYMKDERFKRGDSKTVELTHISEDLMSLSIEMNVPILVVVQANRGGAGLDEDETPELESIRDSDGISHNATKVISLRQTQDGVLILEVKKQRNGIVGTKCQYTWNADKGEFISLGNKHIEKRKIEKEEDIF